MRQKFVGANWKMNGGRAAAETLGASYADFKDVSGDIVFALPATLLEVAKGQGFLLCGQDCHAARSGPYTGDISASQLKEAGADYVILGHSERRQNYGESNSQIAAKVAAAECTGLGVILCIGETRHERENGQTLAVLSSQLAGSLPDESVSRLVIAYEPVWAIGTGLVPSSAEISEVHAHIRAEMGWLLGNNLAATTRIIYGGSVNAGNAAQIFSVEGVDGALVGGASLEPQDFLPILAALFAVN